MVEYLVEYASSSLEQTGLVNFEGENIEGAPPLWCASAAGHLKIVKYLVGKGANVNSTTKSNSTALRAACFDGHLDIVKFLVENSADIEIANRHGHTCLMIACYKGHLAIAKYLIQKSADLNRKSVKGRILPSHYSNTCDDSKFGQNFNIYSAGSILLLLLVSLTLEE